MKTLNKKEWALLVGNTFCHGWVDYVPSGWTDTDASAESIVEDILVFQDEFNDAEGGNEFPMYGTAANGFSAQGSGRLVWASPTRFIGWCEESGYSHLEAKFTNPEYHLIVKTYPGRLSLIAPDEDTLKDLIDEKAPVGAIKPIVLHVEQLTKLGLKPVGCDVAHLMQLHYAWIGYSYAV